MTEGVECFPGEGGVSPLPRPQAWRSRRRCRARLSGSRASWDCVGLRTAAPSLASRPHGPAPGTRGLSDHIRFVSTQRSRRGKTSDKRRWPPTPLDGVSRGKVRGGSGSLPPRPERGARPLGHGGEAQNASFTRRAQCPPSRRREPGRAEMAPGSRLEGLRACCGLEGRAVPGPGSTVDTPSVRPDGPQRPRTRAAVNPARRSDVCRNPAAASSILGTITRR